MRLHLRPGYLFHKSFNQALVSLSVWRDNRAASEAFRDPALLNRIHAPWKGSGSKSRSQRLTGLAAFAAMGVMVFNLRNSREPDLLSESRKMPSPPAVAAASMLPSVAAQVPEPPKLVSYPADGSILIACKRDRTLYVYKRDSAKWIRTAAFPMAIGRNSGDKGDAGDLRTPEGRFWITGLVSGPAKGPKYGPLVFTLNYPRPGDLAEGKTGEGIWIHGVDAGKLPSYTHGCLSLANEDMLALARFADIATPVVILSDSLAPEPARQVDLAGLEAEYPSIVTAYGRKTAAEAAAKEKVLRQAGDFVAKESKDYPELAMQALSEEDRKAVLARLDQWRADWSSRSIEAYAANYDADFHDRQGHDKQAFIERKRRIFATKSRIEMEIKEPHLESEGYSRVKASFRQDYLAEGAQGVQRSSEPKTLRLDEGPGGWLIITE